MIKTTTDFFIMYNGKLTMCAIVAYYMVLSAICCIHKKTDDDDDDVTHQRWFFWKKELSEVCIETGQYKTGLECLSNYRMVR